MYEGLDSVSGAVVYTDQEAGKKTRRVVGGEHYREQLTRGCFPHLESPVGLQKKGALDGAQKY